ncbi:MAG: hypothetical protein H0W33_00820, partial [Gammaproteobacteria bacterium]|nr:hypothetical protein [Gammaproteobacteria bacterium]
ILTALLILAFFVILAYALMKISSVLESIGGTPTSYLARLRLGLRAIEKETSHLGPQVTAANEALSRIADGLVLVDQHLVDTVSAVSRQQG